MTHKSTDKHRHAMHFVLVTSQVINDRNYRRFAIDQLNSRGQLTIIDVTEMLYPDIFNKQYPGRKKNMKTIFVDHLTDLEVALKECHDADLVVSLLGNLYESNRGIYSLLNTITDQLCIVAISAFPTYWAGNKDKPLKRALAKFHREGSLLSVLKRIIYIFRHRISKQRQIHARYILSCGDCVTQDYSVFFNKNTEIIRSCSYDYIISTSEQNQLIDGRYMVFIDQNIIRHTDLSIYGVIEVENDYYYELARLFSFIESTYDVQIIIAAHPRSGVAYTQKKFPQQQVLLGNTAALIENCEACITHASTAINFAVIYRKPIILVTSDRMIKTYIEIDLLASWFEKKPLNMSIHDQFNLIDQQLEVDEQLYQRYFQGFISYSNDCEFGFTQIIERLG